MKTFNKLLLVGFASLALCSCGPRQKEKTSSSTPEEVPFNFDFSNHNTMEYIENELAFEGHVTDKSKLSQLTDLIGTNDYYANKAVIRTEESLKIREEGNPEGYAVDGNYIHMTTDVLERDNVTKKLTKTHSVENTDYAWNDGNTEIVATTDNQVTYTKTSTTNVENKTKVSNIDMSENVTSVKYRFNTDNDVSTDNLSAGDYIEVLQDSTQNNAKTYYKFDGSNLTLVGKESLSDYSDESYYALLNLINGEQLYQDYIYTPISEYEVAGTNYSYYGGAVGGLTGNYHLEVSHTEEITNVAKISTISGITLKDGKILSAYNTSSYSAYYQNSYVQIRYSSILCSFSYEA